MTLAVSTRDHVLRRSRPRETIAIVGGGAAGTLAAIHLVNRAAARRVVLIERSSAIGEGIAYATRDERHLLNVPADRMSAYGDDPGHFARWLEQSDRANAGREAFAPRFRFGDYLRKTLAESAERRIDSVAVETVRGLAAAVHATATGVEIVLADGTRLGARRAVFAIGQQASQLPWPDAARLVASERYVADPWAAGALDHIRAGDRVALAGTGLTMVDVAITLAARGARLEAVSRHGLLPRAHAPERSSEASHEWSSRGRVVDLLRDVRKEAAMADTWQATIDGVRPHAQDIWRCSSFDAQSQFLRHLRRYWEVHRHRMAPAVAAELSELIATERLNTCAGVVLAVAETADAIEISLRPRFAEKPETLRVDHLVNCSGPNERIDVDPQPILASLFEQGLAQPDAHGLGLAMTEHGELVGARHLTAGSLFALGGLRRGTLWETTAIAEIRAQAEALAALVAQRSGAISP